MLRTRRLALVLITASASLAGQTISSISPTGACFNGPSLTLTVNGSGFIYGGGFGNSSVVRWNGTNLPTAAVSSSQLTATVASSYLDTAGAAAITVFNQHLLGPPSTSNTVTFTVYTYAQIVSVTSPLCADGTSSTITVNSSTSLSNYSVKWNNTTLSSSNLGWSGAYYQRSATVPGSQLGSQGLASVRIVSPQGCESSPYTVSMLTPPAITSISPSFKPQGSASTTLTVNGSGFQPDLVVNWDGIALPTTYVNVSQLQATIDDSFLGRLGSATITVVGGPCGSASGSQTFDVLGPTMTSVSPTAIGVGASTVTLTVNGTGMSANTDVVFESTVLTTTLVSSTQVTAVVPANLLATMGTKAVGLRHFYFGGAPQFAFSATKAFTVQGPTLQRLIPDRVPAGSAQFTMTLRGTSLQSGGFVPTLVRWNGANHVPTYVDSTTLQLSVTPAMVATAGAASIDVIVPLSGGGSRTTNALSFAIEPPGITNVASGWTVESGADVRAATVVNGTLYLGGWFDYVGPLTGPAVALSTTYGFPQDAIPTIAGTVNAVVPDGTGGWFIGGSFSAVGPFPRSNLARLGPNGIVDPYFNARTNGPVYALSINAAGHLFVGGDFSSMNQGTRHNLGAVTVANGELTDFNPCPNGAVTSLAAEGAAWVIAVGSFGVVAGTPAPMGGLAALWPTNGDLYDWDFNGGSPPAGTPVLVRGDGPTVYVVTSTNLTARSIYDGGITASFGTHTVSGGVIRDLEVHSSLIFIGGSFTSADGQARGRVAAFAKTNGALQSFDPGANDEVWSIDEDAGYLYAGGDFTQFAGVPQKKLGSVLYNFGTPGYFKPDAENGDVRHLVVSGSSVGAFGTFNSVGGQPRKNLAAIDLASGTLIANWQADTAGPTGVVRMLATDANWLYVGGIFSSLDGQPCNRLGRVGLTSGNIDPVWNPNPNSQVDAIALGPSSLFVAGLFSSIGGTSRQKLAEVDLATGAATALDVSLSVQARCLAVQGSTLYVGGYMTSLGGLPRTNVGAIDLGTGTVTDFAPVLNGQPETIVADGGTVFLAGNFTTVNGVATSHFAALRASDGLLLPLDPAVNGPVVTMTRSGATFFIGGSFTQVGGQPRTGAAAFDVGSLLPRAWAPSISGTVESVDLGANRVFVSGNLSASGLQGIGVYPLGGPFPTPILSSLGTTSAAAGSATFTLSLQGSAFTSGSACRFGGVYVPTAFVSATQLQATIDAALLADAAVVSVDVVAPAPGAGVSQALSFSIENPAPTASSLNPTTGPYNGAAFTLTVTGSGFSSQSVVRWNGTNLPTTPVSASQVQASVAAGFLTSAGPASITVFNPAPGGGTSGALAFTVEYPAPAVSTLLPSSGVVGGPAFALTVTGGPFYAASVVRWDGAALPTSLVSGSQLSAQVGAGLLLQAGPHSVDVVNPAPGGGVSAVLAFTVLNPLPQVATLAPSAATAGDPGFTLQVTGSAFVASSVVRWNGAGLATTFVSPTLLQATVAAALLASGGTISVDVNTPVPGGGTSGAELFVVANPAPSATQIAPATVTAGGPTFSLGITGAGVNGQSVVLADGVAVPTSFVDSTHLSAQIDASLIVSGAVIAIVVSNPAPGGGLSGTLPLSVQNPVPVLAQLAPSSVPAGVPAFQLVLTGAGFVPASWVTWNGITLVTTFTSQAQIQATVDPMLTAFGGSATVAVSSPAPGGGASSALLFSIVAPQVTALSPNSSNLLQPSDPPILLTITGSGFSPAAVAYAGDAALATFYSSATQLFATVPSSLLQTQFPSALVISVLDGTAHSNGLPLRFGTGLNQGWIMKSPPSPAPGQAFALVIEGCDPGAPFTLFWDAGAIAPITPFPTAAANEVLALNPLSPSLAVIFDGLGFAGPPQPIAFGVTPQGPAPGGRFVLEGLTHPNPPLGAAFSFQAAYPSAGSAWGIHLTWGVLMTF